MNIKTERLKKEHLHDVAMIEQSCFAEPWSEKSLELLLDKSGVGFAVLDGDGRAIAYGGMIIVLDEAQITNIATLPEYRRRGLARCIMNSLLEYGKENGVSVFTLEVRESNAAARALYLSMGWQEIGQRKGFYRFPVEDAVVMRKTVEVI